MKNITILTINDNTNYGNRLQNYALSQLLSQFGNVTTILMSDHARAHERAIVKQTAKMMPRVMKARRQAVAELTRNKRFYQFTNRYVPDNIVRISKDGAIHTKKRIDRVVIGSDQVWNYLWFSPSELKLMMGSSFPAHELLSYAASFGVDHLDDGVKPLFKQCLSRIPHLSVREEAAVDMIEGLLGEKPQLVLDPTLAIDPAQWAQLARRSAITPAKPYVLTYFLGTPTQEQNSYIHAYAKKHGLEVRAINDSKDTSYSSGPIEFVGLFQDASYVFTDSFHACCFSVIFNKGFQVFNRNSKIKKTLNSRMETLFSELQIENTMNRLDVYPFPDYAAVNARLQQLREDSITWLKNALA